ncbi:GTP-binding protein [Streptomyces sp. NRRL S-350]|uniref:GTP-binding protein n=1 Tax=Streptomyces sp. NRRL S-350 TaxID=1463902 RepID=UPI00099DFAC2|nr:GTP-binding protein [Streptomyces sp. NRRL S-350]
MTTRVLPEGAPAPGTPARPDDTLRVAFVGEVDHGKSTLLGRLLLDTESVTADRLEVPVEKGGLAFLLDGLTEERADLFTLDTASAVVETGRRRYVLIDVPGHAELLVNMATGASRAEAAVIVVDCRERAAEQTRRHMRVLALLGVTAVVCAVTKMDLVDWAEAEFRAAVGQVAALADEIGLTLVTAVPVSAMAGDNVTTPTAHLSWYTGRPLLDTLAELTPWGDGGAPLRVEAQDAVGGRVLARVLSGELRAGDVLVAPGEEARTVLRIERFGEPPQESAAAGDNIGLVLSGPPCAPGTVLAPADRRPLRGDRWRVRVLCTTEEGFAEGTRCMLRRAGADLTATIARVERHWDSARPAPEASDRGPVRFNEVAELTVVLDRAADGDDVRVCAPLGRFMLTDGATRILGLGIVDAIEEGDHR